MSDLDVTSNNRPNDKARFVSSKKMMRNLATKIGNIMWRVRYDSIRDSSEIESLIEPEEKFTLKDKLNTTVPYCIVGNLYGAGAIAVGSSMLATKVAFELGIHLPLNYLGVKPKYIDDFSNLSMIEGGARFIASGTKHIVDATLSPIITPARVLYHYSKGNNIDHIVLNDYETNVSRKIVADAQAEVELPNTIQTVIAQTDIGSQTENSQNIVIAQEIPNSSPDPTTTIRRNEQPEHVRNETRQSHRSIGTSRP